MIFDPELYMGAVCLLTGTVAATLAMLERFHGFGPGTQRRTDVKHDIQEDGGEVEDDERRSRPTSDVAA